MALTVSLPGPLAAVLAAEAARRGQTPDEVAADLLAEVLLPGIGGREPGKPLDFAAAGESASERGGADADDLLGEGFGR
jgi:hypothetical protein